jgi:hypothetical protein
MYKSYRAQQNSPVVTSSILECLWVSADGQSKIAQIIFPQSIVNNVLNKPYGGLSGGHYRFQARKDVEQWCQQCDTSAASSGPQTRNQGQMHQFNVVAPFLRIAIDVARPFPWSNQGNRYLLIGMDYFTKWPEAYATPNQEASTMAEVMVTNFFCCFEVLWELHSNQGHNSESCLI